MEHLKSFIPKTVLDAIQSSPLPQYQGYEPCEIEVQRIRKLLSQDRFVELSRANQRWVCHRLLPSLTRYGCYPPPQ